MTPQKQELYTQIRHYLQNKPIRKAAVFGSFARDEEKPESDIDLLIETQGMSFFDILRLEDDLEQITNRKIDIVEYSAIKQNLKHHILSKTVVLL